ncbi:hypothetical protein J6590_059633 [Homalodisca vitripennis]|nr:hypothetical protein J6590_059633 [Homalodisca vitripennis]
MYQGRAHKLRLLGGRQRDELCAPRRRSNYAMRNQRSDTAAIAALLGITYHCSIDNGRHFGRKCIIGALSRFIRRTLHAQQQLIKQLTAVTSAVVPTVQTAVYVAARSTKSDVYFTL